jgi:Flp pilus assembly protein TadG
LNGVSTSAEEKRSNPESGQAIILAVACLGIFMFGAIGLGIDGGQIFAQHQMAQSAADAAAQAAIMSMLKGTNSTSTHPFSVASSFTCTVPPALLDLRTPCVYAQDNGFGTNADTVTVSFPSTVTGVTLSSVSSPAVSVRVQRVVRTGFMRFFGRASSTIYAKASAGILSDVSSNCVYVLDPASAGAFQASNGASVAMNCGIAVDSSSATAATIIGGATVTASAISIAGGYSVNNGGSVSPAPISGAPVTADPFASVRSPAVGSCNYTNYNPGYGSWTLNPGTYCGGIIISNGATAVFNPGTYVINGGGIHFAGGSTITGSGVMFYLTGTNSSYGSAVIDNGVTVTLSAETSGPYLGLLFYQDRSITSNVNATFAGGASMQLTGSLYFPTTFLSYSNGTSSSGTTALVAKQISFAGGAHLVLDPTGLKTGLGTKTAGLLE